MYGVTHAGAFLLLMTKIARIRGGPLGRVDIMLASVKSAALHWGRGEVSYIVIYAEELLQFAPLAQTKNRCKEIFAILSPVCRARQTNLW